eukprot:TRINITY_DN19445_c0_g1_i3.p1 TRINITY_DN19445_c0_g1~~TRINITY_DN19445_c0_g1_i3.p1  ORF type:complete len:298 (-),score=89.72 TRINITY_DN19445_c0_g1_i3:177-1070(-)
MKAGSTLVWQVLGAATQLSIGLDCEQATSSPIVELVAQRKAPLERVVQLCHDELFRWGLAKDPMATLLARRLASAWPALAGFPLRLYYVVRNPFDCTRSFLQHLGLRTYVNSPEEQQFSWGEGRFPAHFSRGKQLYLDVSLSGLNYSGYVDAALQRWAIFADEYLACPERFALVRYEEFVADPPGQTERLLKAMNLSSLWLPGAAERAKQAASVQYQTSSGRGGKKDFAAIFGATMLSRMEVAVRSRAEALGYGHLLRSEGASSAKKASKADAAAAEAATSAWKPIAMPPWPARNCV